tara:strand:+ start:286 stop:963 length:678 start_codon:yes stop_codon:yes gene_type:complete
MKKIINHIQENNQRLPEYNLGPVQVIIKDRFTKKIDLLSVFSDILSYIPDQFIELVDVIYIGEFDFLIKREVNSIYLDGAIYTTNEQDGPQDLKDDLVHEISHAVEDAHKQFIYEDGLIENEYFGKLKRLKALLAHEGYNVNSVKFFNTEFNKQFDDFLYKEIGYGPLRVLTDGLFLAPYSVTSLQEYWARGFEEYYLGERSYLKTLCPYIYNKLQLLESSGEEL